MSGEEQRIRKNLIRFEAQENEKAFRKVLKEFFVPLEKQKCLWKQDEDGNFHTGCGTIYTFIESGPPENGFKACPFCGALIEVSMFGSQTSITETKLQIDVEDLIKTCLPYEIYCAVDKAADNIRRYFSKKEFEIKRIFNEAAEQKLPETVTEILVNALRHLTKDQLHDLGFEIAKRSG